MIKKRKKLTLVATPCVSLVVFGDLYRLRLFCCLILQFFSTLGLKRAIFAGGSLTLTTYLFRNTVKQIITQVSSLNEKEKDSPTSQTRH